ncbi:universal stress protein [Chrysiogenes arsenatis]|uniref:universal stress protein n=1 Tax=Chrysiogenes arsenatis TaxID=309797 RepID=UPI00041B368E|nr:universal stress protein [Chrysiogenes arsenatis]
MFKKFIVATDLSPASYAMTECLKGLQDFEATDCLLLQCLSFAHAAATAYSYQTESLEELMDAQKKNLEQQGFTVETRIVVGSPKQEINRIAAKEQYDLIVLGTQGQSLAEEKILGGVAFGVLNKSQKPVLVVPVEKSGENSACTPFGSCGFGEHILFATDFSEMADNAFSELQKLITKAVKKITLVHVQDKIKIEQHLKDRLEEFNEHDRSRLAHLKRLLLKNAPTLQVHSEVCYGIPHEEICRSVQENGATMVVMGTQGRGFVREFFLGSVSHSVVRNSLVPVLLIPMPE